MDDYSATFSAATNGQVKAPVGFKSLSLIYRLEILLVMTPVAGAVSMVVPAPFTGIWELGCAFLGCEGQ